MQILINIKLKSCLLLLYPSKFYNILFKWLKISQAGKGLGLKWLCKSGDFHLKPIRAMKAQMTKSRQNIYSRDNLIAWCIVPFDSKNRGPVERAEMLNQLGINKFAYDWREKYIPTFDPETEMIRIVKNSKYHGLIGIINEEIVPDAEAGLTMNMDGLKKIRKELGDSVALKTCN